jgi:hypothetical protein
MPITTKYLFMVSMDVMTEKEALFNEVYDTEHVPLLLKVPGVRAVTAGGWSPERGCRPGWRGRRRPPPAPPGSRRNRARRTTSKNGSSPPCRRAGWRRR